MFARLKCQKCHAHLLSGCICGEVPVAVLSPSSNLSQLGKFVAVGTLNTAIDFGVFNLLSWLTGVYAGGRLVPINVPGFVLALLNSYVLNKYWTFKATARRISGAEFGVFALVSLIGLSINTATCVAVTSVSPAALASTPALWENVAKVLATGVSLGWNFVGYKYLVFFS